MNINSSLKFGFQSAEVASYTLIIWEHLLTLHKETSLVWARKDRWSLSIVIFTFTRYFALAWSIIGIAVKSSGEIQPSGQLKWEYWQYSSTFVQMISVQVFLMVRMNASWAITSKCSRVLFFVIPLWVFQVVAAATVLVVSLPKSNEIPWRLPVHLYMIAHWVIIASFEFILLFLLCQKAKDDGLTTIQAEPWQWLIKSSSLFFVIICLTHLGVIVLWSINPSFGVALRPLIFAVTTATGNRLLLELRQLYNTNPRPIDIFLFDSEDSYFSGSPRSASNTFDDVDDKQEVEEVEPPSIQLLSEMVNRLPLALRKILSNRNTKPREEILDPRLKTGVLVVVEQYTELSSPPSTPSAPSTPSVPPIPSSPSSTVLNTIKRSISQQLRFGQTSPSPSPSPSSSLSPSQCSRDDSPMTMTRGYTESSGSIV